MIKYIESPSVTSMDLSPYEQQQYVINYKGGKLMSLKQFQWKFNKGDIDDTGLIAIIPPVTYKDK